MPRAAVEGNSRMSLRIRVEEKAMLLRAVGLKHTDLTDFVLQHALRATRAVIEEAERVQVSERDSLRVLWICWKTRRRQMKDYWLLRGHCPGSEDFSGVA